VLEEVQVPIGLGDGVVDRVFARHASMAKREPTAKSIDTVRTLAASSNCTPVTDHGAVIPASSLKQPVMHLKRSSDRYGQGVSMPHRPWPPVPKPASQPTRNSREAEVISCSAATLCGGRRWLIDSKTVSL
jgi:hypothetical protein